MWNMKKRKKLGRPKVDNPLSSSERAKRSKQNRVNEGKKVRNFWLSEEQIKKYSEMRAKGVDYDQIVDLAYRVFCDAEQSIER